MNYIEETKRLLQKEFKFDGEYVDLLDMYALLFLIKGKECSNEDIHNAWSIWQNRINPEHESLLPFDELTDKIAHLDSKYRDVIRDISHKN